MIKKHVISTICLICISLSFCFAQKREVEDAVSKLTKLMVAPDSIALDHLVLGNLSYGHSSGKIQTKSEFLHSLLSGESDFVEINLSEQSVIVENKTALVRHTLSAKTNDRGVAGNVKLYILLIWAKERNGWKLLGRQAVKIP